MGQYYAINGSFLLEPALGVQRYAAEILKQMNKMAPAYKECLRLVLVLPETPRIEEIRREFSNIEVRCAGKSRRVKVWEQVCFARFLKKEKAKGICLCNTVPLFSKGGLVCVHDIVFKTHPEYIKEPGAWHEILYRKWMYTHAFHKADIIVTVSETSKKEILEQYRVRAGQIYVAGNGWQHMDRKDTDETIFQKYPKLTKGAYYYYLASLAPNKNLSWILKNAAGNPDKIYVLSGKPLGDDSGVEKLDNVICTGYVSDSEARALMQYCRAFLFPSTYEGFGIPPMEALCMGAPVVLGDIPVLHEIYGNAAYYVDCDNADISIEQLLKQGGREAPETVLSRYSWEKSARIMMEALTK